MDKIILVFCSLLSCIIIVNIMFQFMNDRYNKIFENMFIYKLLPVGYVLLITGVNTFMIPVLNMAVQLLLFGVAGSFFYFKDDGKKLHCLIEVETLFIVIVVSETLGVYLLDSLLNLVGRIPDSPEILRSMETAFSKVILIFLYYVLFSRFWIKTDLRTKEQYRLYFILFLYSAINILLISFISEKESPIILMIAVGSVIFCNMYMLYFIQFSDERNIYKLQVEMMEQQEKLQYGNYKAHMEKYNEAIKIIHDVDKYVKSMKSLYKEKLIEEAVSYADQISDRLKGLLPAKYSGNPIINCLLSEKKKEAEMLGIQFMIENFTGDLDFMASIDITTLFGNLIDNAMAAVEACTEDRYIGLSVEAFNEMISIRIKNTVNQEISIKHGKMLNKGIGILNIERCVTAYEGNISYSCEKNVLCCDILLNRVDKS
ncbi:MAG: GHKL domain-containing protein [Roseburia sp.]|nr:GHKL domain-containing protein [Roseburia sp.]